MDVLAAEIIQRQPTESQILCQLRADYPAILDDLENPVEWIKEVGTLSVDRHDRRADAGSFWRFWKQGLDLQHLRNLAKQPEGPPARPKSDLSDRFAALPPPSLPAPYLSPTSSAVVGGRPLCPTPTQPQSRLSHAMGSTGHPPNSRSSDELAHDSLWRSGTSEPSLANVLRDPVSFCSRFGFAKLPTIPQTSRNLDVLLADGDIWSFSMDERQRIATAVTEKAKGEVPAELLARFGDLVRRHDNARQSHEEAQANVSI